MADFNPNRPAVLGNEWMTTRDAREQVRTQGWVQRLPSLGAETVTELRMAAEVDPSATAGIRTLIDVIPEGSEQPGPVQTVYLSPNGTDGIGTWTTLTGSATNLHLAVDDPITWPSNTVAATGIRDQAGFSNIRFTVDASDFAATGPWENARICRVHVAAVAGVIAAGFRSIRFELRHVPSGVLYNIPANTVNPVQVHSFGLIVDQLFGELNPRTGLPWLPADIVEFGPGGDWQIHVRSQDASTSTYPVVWALALAVDLIQEENRSAVGVYTRPASAFGAWLVTPSTSALLSLPDGTPGWSKPASGNFLYWWRQARSTYFHGGQSVASDLRWIRQYQDLGSGGNPAGAVPPPSDLRADRWTVDNFGIPAGGSLGDGTFGTSFVSAASLALVTGDSPAGSDDFNRVEVATWGTSSGGDVWVEESAAASDRSVNGTQGVITLQADPSAFRLQTLSPVRTDAEVVASVTPDQLATGSSFLPGILFRRTDGSTSEFYRFRLQLATSGAVAVAVTRGATQVGSTVITSLTYGANDTLWMRARVDGHRVRGRVWADGSPEPTTWDIDELIVSDQINSGRVGVSASAFVSNTNVNPAFAFDALSVTAPGISPDSQPYRATGFDRQGVIPSTSVGQRVTPATSASYLGVRTVVAPPVVASSTLRIAVHRVSDGVQVGGHLSMTASDVRSFPDIGGGLRYIEGFLTSAASLSAGVAYEIRFSATGSGWVVLTPSCALGASASFGGATNGVILAGSTHDPDRDMVVNLQVQPDPPQNLTAQIASVPVDTYTCSVETVQHVQLDWEPGAAPLGPGFSHYSIERQLLADVAGTPCEPVQPSMLALTGLSGATASTPDRAEFTVGANPLRATIELAPDVWNPSGGDLLIGQWPNVGGSNSWVLALTAGGELNFAFADSAGNFDAGNQRTSTATVSAAAADWRYIRATFTPDDGSGTVGDSTDGDGSASEIASTSHVAPSVTADDVNDLLICAWQSFEESPETYTAPGSMTQGTTTSGLWSDLMEATEVVAAGATGTRIATYGQPDTWSAVSIAVFGGGTTPTIEEQLSGYAQDTTVTLTSDASTQAGEWLVAVHGWDQDPSNQMGPPSGSGWHACGDSAIATSTTSRTRCWAKRLTGSGAQQVIFPTGTGVTDNHARLFRLSGVLAVGNDRMLYEVSTDGASYTQIGDEIVTPSGGVAIFDTTADLLVGGSGGQELAGNVRRAEVRVNNVVAASPDFTAQDPGTLSFPDAQANTWTVNGTASIVEDPDAAPILPDDPDCAWTHIADITSSEGTTTFLDREVPRGSEALYRVRTIATTSAFSDWALTLPVTPQATKCEMIFTSNAEPSLEAVYDHEPEVDYTMLNNESLEIVPIAGADYQVVFIEPEDRGKSLSTTVTANFGTQPTNGGGVPIGGVRVFDPLVRLSESQDIPYVVVLDKDGNRWLGHIRVSGATQQQPGHRYTADVTVTPTHGDSLPVEE